jgi:predicted small lipoprotein YifL
VRLRRVWAARPKLGRRRSGMKTVTLLLVLALCLTLVGCGRIHGPVEEVKALMKAKDEALRQISKKLEAAPNAAGVDEARKVFEARRADLKAKRDAMDAKPRGMNSDWMTMWFESNARDAKMWQAMKVKFATDCSYVARPSADECSSAEKELSALEKDFKTTVGSE